MGSGSSFSIVQNLEPVECFFREVRLELMTKLPVPGAIAVRVAPRHLSNVDKIKRCRLDPVPRRTLSQILQTSCVVDRRSCFFAVAPDGAIDAITCAVPFCVASGARGHYVCVPTVKAVREEHKCLVDSQALSAEDGRDQPIASRTRPLPSAKSAGVNLTIPLPLRAVIVTVFLRRETLMPSTCNEVPLTTPR